MTSIWAKQALLPDGWRQNVSVEIDMQGKISAVVSGHPPAPAAQRVGVLLPSPVNAHSHAFQRAMAGLSERRGPHKSDTFWTWRQLMFRFLEQLTPEHVQAIAALVQMEMLEAGYSTNVEFHYLHHQPNGQPYDHMSEMAQSIIAAAAQTGIGLTLLPVHYQYGGCDQRPLGAGQVRLGTDLDAFEQLWQSTHTALKTLPSDTNIGVAPHSLRAIDPHSLPQLLQLAGDKPFHLHLAEQHAETLEVQAVWGKRPVEWLLDNADIDAQWCLIHCTQMLPHETKMLAKTGAVAGLCPITESSLGDGIFDAVRWFDQGGRVAIGSDSNIRIALAEELRTLEYSQRLRDHSRAALATSDKSTGRRIFDAICAGGAQAAGRKSGMIKTGNWADLMVLDDAHIDLSSRTGDTLLDTYIFAGSDRMVTELWAAGRHMVKDGQHVARGEITRKYMQVLQQLEGMI